MSQKTIFFVVIIVLILGVAGSVLLGVGNGNSVPNGKYDALATCLKDKGAVFYGAFWCPHCQATKKAFGSAEKLLPYVECSTPDGQSQNQICIDKKIEGYPTWIFADGSRLTGEVSMQDLGAKTGCLVP